MGRALMGVTFTREERKKFKEAKKRVNEVVNLLSKYQEISIINPEKSLDDVG